MVSRPDNTNNSNSDGESSDSEVADEDEEDGDVHSRALMHLFEISLELLSLSTEQQQATRGLRDSVKKTWQVIMVVQGAYISVDVLDSIVAAVIGEHPEDQDEEDHENQEEDDQMGRSQRHRHGESVKKRVRSSEVRRYREVEEEEELGDMDDQMLYSSISGGGSKDKAQERLESMLSDALQKLRKVDVNRWYHTEVSHPTLLCWHYLVGTTLLALPC